MAYEPIIPIAGNIITEPELRFTPQGVAVCNFKVGVNDARPDQNDGKTNVPSLVFELAAWRELGEHCAESLAKGMRITANVKMEEIGAYTDRDGNPQGTVKVKVLEIGPSLRWAEAKVTKAQGGNQQNRGNQQTQGGGGNQQGGNNGGWGQPTGNDPWANQGGNQQGQAQQTQQGQQDGGGWGNPGGGWGTPSGQDPWGQAGN